MRYLVYVRFYVYVCVCTQNEKRLPSSNVFLLSLICQDLNFSKTLIIIFEISSHHSMKTSSFFITLDCTDEIENVNVFFGEPPVYNTPGLFACNDDGILFFLNGSLPESKETVCLYAAEWKEEKNVQC